MAKDYPPQMHSAEHILNQTMVRMFNCGRSFSAHIEKKKSKCDYHFNRNLTDAETEEIGRRVNEVIAADMPVTRCVSSVLVTMMRVPAVDSMCIPQRRLVGSPSSPRLMRMGH